MRILITGAAGFVATHLIKTLSENPGNQIFAWVKSEEESGRVNIPIEQIYIVDITKKEMVESAVKDICPDVVYHLAAQSSVGLSWKDPTITYEINIIGTSNLLEAVRRLSNKATVLLIGSAEQYGRVAREELPIRECCERKGTNPYSISKITQEIIAQMYVKEYGMRIICVRAFNHIGPGQDTKFVIPDWCSQIVSIERDERPPVIKVGNIGVRRDFTDVRDIVRAYIGLTEAGKSGEVYNVGSGISYSLQEILEMIIASSSKKGIHYEIDKNKLRPGDIEELRGDITKLQQDISWEPRITVKESILDIIRDLREK